MNPISRLIQIQQAKKEKEPVYTLIVERGLPRRREFFMKVTVGANSAVGSGPNKKVAKRAAAEVGIKHQGRFQECIQGGELTFFFLTEGEHPLGPENNLKSINFIGPG